MPNLKKVKRVNIEGIDIEFMRASMETIIKYQKEFQALDNDTDTAKQNEIIPRVLSEIIVSWNLTEPGDDGKDVAVPITAEAIEKQPMDFLLAVNEAFLSSIEPDKKK